MSAPIGGEWDDEFRKAHKIWIEQCEAGQTIRACFICGIRPFVDEKIMNFVEAASQNRQILGANTFVDVAPQGTRPEHQPGSSA